MENTQEILSFRDAVWQAGANWIDAKRKAAEYAMQAAQEAANGESKSSAGDKYETGRAMAQNDRDLYASQWAQWNDLHQQIQRFRSVPAESSAMPGSLMETTLGWFWVSISIGRILVHDQTVTILSPHSPLGKTLVGKKVGEPFLFQGKEGRVMGLF